MQEIHIVPRLVGMGLTLLLLVQAGCRTQGVSAQTSKPLFDPDKDARFDEGLVGTWLPDYFCINLNRGPGKSYVAGGIGWATQDSVGQFTQPSGAHLVPIGKYQYLFRDGVEPGQGTSLSTCCRVTIYKRCVVLEGLNISTIIDDLRNHPDALQYTWTPGCESEPATQPSTRPATQPAALPTSRPYVGNLEFTDDPKAVRAYLVKHQDDPQMYAEPTILHRIAP